MISQYEASVPVHSREPDRGLSRGDVAFVFGLVGAAALALMVVDPSTRPAGPAPVHAKPVLMQGSTP